MSVNRYEELYKALEQSIAIDDRKNIERLLRKASLPGLSHIWPLLDEKTIRSLLTSMERKKRVELIPMLQTEEQEGVIRLLSLDKVSDIFADIPPDDLVDIIQAVAPTARAAVWNSLSEKDKDELQFLLRYDEDDAAGLMTSRYFALRPTITVGHAIKFVRTAGKSLETVYYIYIVDVLKRLMGVVSLRKLLAADDEALVKELMDCDLVVARDETDQEDAAKLLEDHHLLALPVVDPYNRLLGIITFDDVIAVIRKEETEDVYKMGAMEGSADPYTKSSVMRLIRKRVPWLVLLLLAGTVTSNVISTFEGLIVAASYLVLFVPVVMQTGGNAGTQSATLIIRGLAMNEIHFRDISLVIAREVAVGALMGAMLGIVLFFRGILLPPGITAIQATAISISLAGVVFFSSIIGAIAPMVLHRLKLDPTVVAGPLMATLIDVVGITIYFQTARLLLPL